MKFENTEVFNFDGAIRGMRNPLESWQKSDSRFYQTVEYDGILTVKNIGEKDLELMQTLIRAGSEHRKFMRQIFVSVDITASLYWWKEFDTYKVGTAANSTSTMHRLASTPITMDCFEVDDFDGLKDFSVIVNDKYVAYPIFFKFYLIGTLEQLRQKYNETKNIRYWKELIRLLPESWLQKRTVTMNYENVLNMVRQRKNHKLTEWRESFMKWAKSLPYAKELLFIE